MRTFLKIAAIAFVVMVCAGRSIAGTINVAAAISLREAMTDAAAAYESGGGDHVVLTFGSSGQLAAQITSGAPIDAFVSAANKQVDELTQAGLADEATRRVVAGNELVLVVPHDEYDPPSSIEKLVDPSVRKVAIGEPKTVPAGEYAMQVLVSLKIDTALQPKLVYGTNVRQVLDYVERGEVSAGLVYATDARQSGDKVRVVATADATTHKPIVYPAVVVKNSKQGAAAVNFLDYLATDAGRAALTSRGFTTPTCSAPAQVPAHQ